MVVSQLAQQLTSMASGSNKKAPFADVSTDNMSFSEFLIFLIVFVVLLVIIILLGTIIFNLTIPKIFPSVRKVSTIEFFGLYVIVMASD